MGPDVGDQLKVLTQKLDLSVDQQPKVKTILQELHDASLKLMQDEKHVARRAPLIVYVRFRLEDHPRGVGAFGAKCR